MKQNKQEKYFSEICSVIKTCRSIEISDNTSKFNNTELRLLGEIAAAKSEGKYLFSTQIAEQLGITRSAVSQIVNRLEKRGVVKRIPDAVNKKIAYVEIVDESIDGYNEHYKSCLKYAEKVVEKFGVDKFEKMCRLFADFSTALKDVK